ncbi:ATP-binding cassette sub-family A member 3-like isoform X3, partial [Leptotrombidium deliense]
MHTSTPGYSSFGILRVVTLLVPNVALADAVVVIQGNVRTLTVIFAMMVLSIPFYAMIVLLFDCKLSQLLNRKDGNARKSGIQFDKVTKQLENGLLALNNVSFEVKGNQMVVIFGGIGSGKSTIVDLLTGTTTQTSGDIVLNGYNTLTNLQSAHTNFKVCLSRNIYYEKLTVLENLRVFAGIHRSAYQAKSEAITIMNRLSLQRVRDDVCANISFQSLRKLSIAIALVGNRGGQTIVLDEPTFGLNNKEVDKVWSTLKLFAKQNTILVTTKSIEESVNFVVREGHLIPVREPTKEHLLQIAFGFQNVSTHIPNQQNSKTVTSSDVSSWTAICQIFKVRFKYVYRNLVLYLWHVIPTLVLLSLFLLIERFFVNQIHNEDQNFNVTEKYGPNMALYLGSDTSP